MIFAGGTGKRMGCSTPKQFLPVCGKEIIMHTLEIFENNENIDEIYVGCIKEGVDFLNSLISKYNIKKVKKVIPGGTTGQDTIFKLLDLVHNVYDDAIVLVHDGVRPLISDDTINNAIMSVEKYGSAVTAVPMYETPLIVDNNGVINTILNRNNVYVAKAPQCFYLNDLYNAHMKERNKNKDYVGIVDSCSLMKKYGFEPHIVVGESDNIKVTTKNDYYTLIGNLNARDYNRIEEDD